MSDNNTFDNDWQNLDLDHGQVEDLLKGKFAELESEIGEVSDNVGDKYEKPENGIPYKDLSEGVKDKLDQVTDVSRKANLNVFGASNNQKMLSVDEWPRQVIHDITGGATGAVEGDIVFNAADSRLYAFSTDGGSLDMGTPKKGTIYCDKQTKRTYIWDNGQFERVSEDGIGTRVVVGDEYIDVHIDGYEGDYSDAAVNVIDNMNAIKDKINELINALSSIAFTGDKPAELDDLDWGGTEKPVPELVQPSGTLPINVSNNGDNSTPISVTIKGNNLTDNLVISFTESKEMLSDNGHFVISPLIVTAADANKGTTIDISFTGNETEDGYLYIRSSEVSKFVRIRGTYHSEYQPDEPAQPRYSVTVTSENGGYTGGGDLNVDEGGVYATTFAPDAEHTIENVVVTVNGESTTYTPDSNGQVHIEITVTDDVTIVVNTLEIPKETFHIFTNIPHLSLEGELSAEEGSNWTGTLVADEGYSLPQFISIVKTTGFSPLGGGIPSLPPGSGTEHFGPTIIERPLFTYNSTTGVIAITNLSFDVMISAEGVADMTGKVNVTQKLLHVESDTDDGIFDTDEALVVELTPEVLDETTQPATTATMNGDVRVLIGGVEKFNEATESGTNAAGITLVSGVLTVPAAALTGDVVISATAYVGYILIKSSDSAAKFKVGSTTYTLSNNSIGGGMYKLQRTSGTTDTIGFENAAAKSGITEIDFGGMIFNGSTVGLFKSRSNLAKVEGLVIKSQEGYTMDSFAEGCKRLATLDTIGWEMDNVTSYTSAFKEAGSLVTGGFTFDMDYLVCGNCDDLSSMFFSSGINAVNVSTWDVSNVTTMDSMFQGCAKLNELDLSAWVTSSLTDIDLFASGAGSGSGNPMTVYLGNFDTSGVAEINGMSVFNYLYLHMMVSTPPAMGVNWLSKSSIVDGIYYVPAGAKSAYEEADYWKNYTIQEDN